MMNAEKLELAYLRRVLVGIVEVTIEDLNNERKYKGKNSKSAQQINRAEALAFVRSSAFDVVCDALNIPACRARRACLK
jgi:hypothetical protein